MNSVKHVNGNVVCFMLTIGADPGVYCGM